MAEQPIACLVKIKSGDVTRAHIVCRDSFLVGRSKDAAIPVLDPNSSRHHLQIHLTPAGVTIIDLASNNGTTVDGVRVAQNVPIAVGPENIISLGGASEQFTFTLLPQPIELMNVEQRRDVVSASMIELRSEIENRNQLTLEDEKRKLTAKFRNDYERSLAELRAEQEEKRRIFEDDMQTQYEATMKRAQESASKLIVDSEMEAQDIVKVASAEAQKVKKVAQEHVQTQMQATRTQMDEIILRAEMSAKELQQKAQAKIQADTRSADEQSKERARAIEGEAKKAAADYVQQAKVRSENEVFALIKKHKGECDQLRKDLELEIKNLREKEIEKIRKETLIEQENIIASHRETLSKLKSDKAVLESVVHEIQGRRDLLNSSVIELDIENQKMNKLFLEGKAQLSHVQEALAAAKAAIARGEQAEQNMENLESRAQLAQNNLEAFTKEVEQGRLQIEREFQVQRDKAILDFENLLRANEELAAKSHLQAMNKLKESILEEEKKYFRMKELRATELTDAIAGALLSAMGERSSDRVDSGLVVELVRASVEKNVLGNYSTLQPEVMHLGQDKEAIVQKKILFKKYAYAAAVVALLTLGYFWSTLFAYLQKLENAPGYVDYLIAKKSAESIYVPPQDNEWRETYAGNILYLNHYHEAKTEPAYRDQWTILLNDVDYVRSMGLNEEDIVSYLGKEAAMIEQLWQLRQSLDAKFLDEGLQKMNTLEFETTAAMKQLLKSETNFEKVRNSEKDFTLQYIARRFGGSPRKPTGDGDSD